MKPNILLLFISVISHPLAASGPSTWESPHDWREEAKKEKPYLIDIAFGEISYDQKTELKNFDLAQFKHFERLTFSTSPRATNEIKKSGEFYFLTKITENELGFDIRVNFTLHKGESRMILRSGAFAQKGEWVVLGTIPNDGEVEEDPDHLIPDKNVSMTAIVLRITPNS